jgi:SAM-dependent methyltransferase
MRKKMDPLIIVREIIKNLLMGNPLFRFFRTKIGDGRTTGILDTNAAFQYCTEIVDQYQQGLRDAGLDPNYFENKNILEIGPGANLAVQVNLILQGAARAYAIDRFSEARHTHKEAEIYEKLFQFFQTKSKVNPATFYKLNDQSPIFIGDKIKYFDSCGIENADRIFSKEFDVVVSHLALECIKDLSQGIHTISKIIKPGGICIFICNLKSLGVFGRGNEPLRLLNYSNKLWKWMYSNRGGPNRVRAYGYHSLLKLNHFKILNFVVLDRMQQAELDQTKTAFNKQFKKLSDDELSILEFRIVAQYQGKDLQ